MGVTVLFSTCEVKVDTFAPRTQDVNLAIVRQKNTWSWYNRRVANALFARHESFHIEVVDHAVPRGRDCVV